ncbi:MAG: hypothetical protein K2P99_03495 [Burkholderiales bacterium]|nr:hypothetical protein [Burkholderiales bacterium]
MKKVFCIVSLLGLISLTNAHQYSSGGWSPVFFTKYKQSQVNQIVIMANEHKIRKIKITCPTQQKQLATKIRNKIETHTKIKPSFYIEYLKDSATTKYTHDTVVVTLYYGL